VKGHRTLGIDPGAVRCGWAVLEDNPKGLLVIGSGIIGLERKEKETYQDYKLRLIRNTIREGLRLIQSLKPHHMVCEIIPAVGGGNFVVATQSHLAATVATTFLTLGMEEGLKVSQVSANTVKRKIGGTKDASKATVRKGVYELMPDMPIKEEWKKVSDESDAYAIALYEMGYSRG
jgi:Holliday junction resolvasome RuvABC endonuclease subunit